MNFKTFDTETQDGKAFLTCTYDGKNSKDYLMSNKQDVIDFFNSFHSSTRLAFCYNLDYDASALLKYFGQDALIKLYLGQSIVVGNLKIRYIPRKCLYITKYKNEVKQEKLPFGAEEIPADIEQFNRKRRDSQGTIYVYDIWQFFQMPLNKASQKYLNEKKHDVSKKWMKTLKKYFLNPRYTNRIIKYCRQDARLTWLLSKKFLTMLIDAGITTQDKADKGRYYSAGYIAKKYIKSKVNVPYINDQEVVNFMEDAYFGGRIEVMQRGYFDKAYQVDMNSAYPFALANLKKIYHHSFSNKVDDTADYFFADCEFTLNKNYISPVPIRFDIWKYPHGTARATIDNRTFRNIIEAGGTINRVHQSLNIYCENSFPFRATVHRLYAQRSKSEAHKYIFKMLLTAYTGKLNEKKTSTRLVPQHEEGKVLENLNHYNNSLDSFENDIKNNCSTCYYLGKVQTKCRNSVCIEYRKEFRHVKKPLDIYYLGKNMFENKRYLANGTNVIYAGLVTSTIRNAVYEKGIGLGENLIGFLTDGILSRVPVKDTGNGLGEFSKKYEGWLYLLGSGIYQTADGTKFRGFNSEHNLLELSKKFINTDKMEIPSLSRVGMGRAVGSPEKFNQFNMLLEKKPKLNVNFDRNRMWQTPFKNYGEALNRNINSEPIQI